MDEKHKNAIRSKSAEFAQYATEISRMLTEAENFFVEHPGFDFTYTSERENAALSLCKEDGGWQLTISHPADGAPVRACTARVRLKCLALSLLPEFTAAYAQSMKERVSKMEYLLYPHGRPMEEKQA
jgi:hypothetical protein